MPYIALQLVGMTAALKALGLHGEVPLAIAFIVLAAYTYSAGLRAPALIAFVKDIMIYIVVIVAEEPFPPTPVGYTRGLRPPPYRLRPPRPARHPAPATH